MHLASRRILLIGAGHTNLHIVRMWMQQPIPDVSLTLVSPFPCATYSGMLPGILAGQYTPGDMEIDLYQLVKAAGVELVIDDAIGIDVARNEVRFLQRPGITYDVVSIGVGSLPRQMDVLKTHPGFVPIKPMFTALQRLDSAIQKYSGRPVRVAVVGGGAAGVEVAMCVEFRIRSRGGQPIVTLVDANSQILSGFRDRTIQLAEKELRQRNINIRFGGRVIGHDGLDLRFDTGDAVTADVVVWVTGACPQTLLQEIDLPKSAAGFLRVHPTLQSVGNASVFVVGDSASIDGESIDRAGVYAVRQGPILWENLMRQLAGRELISYRPQRDFLRLLATGDGRAIAQWKWIAGIGKHWWKLKDYIDSKFMNMHRPSRAMSPQGRKEMPVASSVDATGSNQTPMRCRGCGGKTSARVLQKVLQRLRSEWPSAPRGFLQHDDTALLPEATPGQSGTNAVSIDFFPAFLSDPWLSGRIAAIHALSDLWASGVRPTSALAMVTIPDGSVKRQSEMLHQVLSGAVHEFSLANTVLVGGHTTNGEELAIGFTVFGEAQSPSNDRLPLSKTTLRLGQQLILTKSLGTGIILAAHAQGIAPARSMTAAIRMMLHSNQRASEIACVHGVSAGTDVTGFGLAGHLLEMCQQSGVSVELQLAALPLLDGASQLIDAGIRSSLFEENQAAVQGFLVAADGAQINDLQQQQICDPDSNPEALQASVRPKYEALFDPQTSGGLLLGVDSVVAERIIGDFAAAGYRDAAIVGRVLDSSNIGITFT